MLVLDRLALSDVIALVPRLGSLKMLAQGEGTGSIRDFDLRTLGAAGMEVAASDDSGVEQMLDTIMARSGSADAIRQPFGGFYEWMAALPEGDLRTWLGERMGAMVGKRGILWTNWRKFVATDPAADRISIAEAGAILGLSEHATRRVIPSAALAAFNTRRRIRPSYERRHVEALRSRLDHTLTVVAAAHRLGTTPRSLRELVRVGLIETDQLAGVAFGNAARFSIETLDRFLDDLSDGAPVFDMPPTGVLRLPVATRRVGNVKLCRALLLRAVRPCGRLSGPKSLSSILISESALGSIRHAGTMGCVATKEAAKILELRERTFNALTAAGHLQAAIHISSTKYYRLSDLENFNRKYITSHEIARASGTNTATVLAVLEETGLRPSIEMESSDRIEVRFFERSRVERRRPINPYQTRARRSAFESPMSIGGRQPLEIQPKQERFVQKTQSV
ncbi:hypothetical protein [Methylobacterium sp.]|uniref:hypothetical protein n=1 Tax=Methylobacterium sp. TaxID=409 RepID=UPI0025EE90DC|nr:hypothetical protein [Methylobacterium sp.]